MVPVLGFILLCCCVPAVLPLYCHVGYGQRGKLREMGIGWDRECPGIRYCFEVITADITKVKKLIDSPWVRFLLETYYFHYYF